jgi:hypothetical protein
LLDLAYQFLGFTVAAQRKIHTYFQLYLILISTDLVELNSSLHSFHCARYSIFYVFFAKLFYNKLNMRPPHVTHELAETLRIPTITVDDSRSVYHYLRDEIDGSKHASRFAARPFNEDVIGDKPTPLDISYPYLPAREVPDEHVEWLSNTVGNLIMPEKNWAALVRTFEDIYDDKDIQKQKRLGKSLLFMCNHLTYADLPALLSASAVAKLNLGFSSPQFTQDILTHRLINLFQNNLISAVYGGSDYESQGGYISDDVLLIAGGQLGILPSTASGRDRFIEAMKSGSSLRSQLNESTRSAFNQLVMLGGRDFFIAPAGSEMFLNEETGELEEGRIGSKTCDLLTSVNPKGEEPRLITIPLFIYANPFTGDRDSLLAPKPTPFAFIKPRPLYTDTDVQEAMVEIIRAGNKHKPSGVEPLSYNPPGPNWRFSLKKPAITSFYNA